jgi:hypothetical protein
MQVATRTAYSARCEADVVMSSDTGCLQQWRQVPKSRLVDTNPANFIEAPSSSQLPASDYPLDRAIHHQAGQETLEQRTIL